MQDGIGSCGLWRTWGRPAEEQQQQQHSETRRDERTCPVLDRVAATRVRAPTPLVTCKLEGLHTSPHLTITADIAVPVNTYYLGT